MTQNADSGGRYLDVDLIPCKASKSGICLLLSEGFWPGCMEGECEYAPDPLPPNGRSEP